jgi:hypothetical protein
MVVPQSRYYPGIYLKGMGNAIKNLRISEGTAEIGTKQLPHGRPNRYPTQ